MKRWNCKNLAAICLSVCLVASQSMIPISAYAQETDTVKTATDNIEVEKTANPEINQGNDQNDQAGLAGEQQVNQKQEEAVDEQQPSGLQSQQNPSDVETVTPVPAPDENEQKDESPAIQITGWRWVDPDQHLTNGALIISGADKNNPMDFNQIVSMLPKEISATVANGEMELTPDSWSCAEFKPDPSGNWPTAGEYTFQAHITYGGGVYPL